ncbi:hypothetical protein Tco_0851531 [Tanacetum coccineum]
MRLTIRRGDSVERAITTDASLVVALDSDNIIRTQTTTMPNVGIPLGMDTGGSPRRQETIGGAPAHTRMEHTFELMDIVPPTPHDSPLPGGYTPGSDEGRLKLEELMPMCIKLSKQEDASKQGWTSDKTKPIFKDSDFNDLDDLVDEGMAFVQEKDAENQGKIGADDTEVVKGSGDTEAVNTVGEGVSTAAPRTPPTTTTVFDDKDVTMAMAQTLIKMKEEKAKEKGVAIKDVKDSSRPIRSITTLQPLLTNDLKDKGKGILQETEPVEKTYKKVQGDAQIKRDAEVALRLQVELDEELRARIDANYELAARMTQEEQEKYTIEDKARLLAGFFERRKKQLAAERAEAIRNKPPTKTQLRNLMMTYLKKMDGYKHSQLKGKSYEEIQGLYERQQERIQDFTPMDSEKEAQNLGKRLKRVARSYATQKSPKKPKVMKSAKDVTEEEEYQLLGKMEEKDMYVYKLTRADGSSSYHKDIQAFLRRLGRQDLNDLYRVHTLFMDGKPMEINMLVEKKYPLVKELLEKMLNLQLEAEEESTRHLNLIRGRIVGNSELLLLVLIYYCWFRVDVAAKDL